MGIYIGFVEKKGYEPMIFFNFKPIAEIRNGDIVMLTYNEQEALLPQSEKRDINLSYKFGSIEQRNEMEAHFAEKSLVIFEFVFADLNDNIRNGVRNQTGYFVNALDMIVGERIRKIESAGIYHIIDKDDILSDFYNDPIVEINIEEITIGSRVYVDLGSFYAGPYEVDFREITQSYYIRPQIKNSKYTISGYSKRKKTIISLSDVDEYWRGNDNHWNILYAKDEADSEQQDVITDALLLESFRESIGTENIKDGRIIIDDIERLLSHYDTSLLSGAYISDAIRKRRLNRLVELLTSEEELTDTLSYITESICGLLIRHKENPDVDEWIQSILEQHPEFWERIRDVRVVGAKIGQLNQTVEELQQQKALLDAEILEKREKAVSIDLQAIEEKKNEMLAVDTKYAESKKRLEELLVTLSAAEDILVLQKRLAKIKESVTTTQSHYDFLRDASRNMEAQFTQLINNQHDKMIGLTFDGFMASKMLKAAAEWEAEDAKQSSSNFVRAANEVSAVDKTPEELVDYLTQTIQIVRPQYSKNTILNIAICTTQGFLTVFSGEPGCGKTSICNIYADVLGLNKIESIIEACDNNSAVRYIPVSVERGWTSKRDFVGYFNPLSKTFDKSNRDVYDALSRLHVEQNEGLSKFPFIILLDEANLSPMEYYWADFMYVCDDSGKKRLINLGENNVFSIPDTLHFVATINNDHTTETLSPRLIDRAWVVQLPQQVGAVSTCAKISDEQIELVTWSSMQNAFFRNDGGCITLPEEIQKIYDAIVAHLRKVKVYISPRVEIAIKRYWSVASSLFEKELGIEPPIVALDYAIAQKVLPKIQGHGEDFERWLDELRGILNKNDLNMSAKIVKDITERGVQQMKYFQFFA